MGVGGRGFGPGNLRSVVAVMTKPPPLPCSRCFSAVEAGDLRCPVCYLAIPESEAAASTAVRVQALRCGSCGAAMEYQAALQTAACGFCGGALKREEIVDPEEQIEQRLPFKVRLEQAMEIYREWISRQGFFRPFNLPSAARLESLHAIWWAGWVVNVSARATWTADSDTGAQKAKWAPHAGELQREFTGLIIPATRGLTADECAGLLHTYDVSGGASDGENRPAEAAVERFEMQRSFARATIVAAIQRLMERCIQAGEIPGRRFRNLHASIQLRKLGTRRVGFPAYVIAYRYRGKLFRTVISGQDGRCVIGEAPRSWGKLALAILAAALAFAGLVGMLRLAQ